MSTLGKIIHRAFRAIGFDIRRIPRSPHIPDGDFYAAFFSPLLFRPWNDFGDFAAYRALATPYTLVSPDRLYVLYSLALNAAHLAGDFWECGVYKGGTARMLAALISEHGRPETMLHLFDTFSGMPETDKNHDLHKKGDFSDTSIESVLNIVGNAERVGFHQGWIPDTFRGMPPSRVTLAHVDVDIYSSVRDCCEFIYPRLASGGVMVFDDYGFPSCPGARKAVDDFFAGKVETPIVLQSGQAIVIRSAAR